VSDKRRALGRGLGALIPGAAPSGLRPVDVFFHDRAAWATPGEAGVPEQTEGEAPDQWPSSLPVGAAEPLVEVAGARFEHLPVAAIRANPRQPRTSFDEDELAELTHSIGEIGVLQPVVVRPIHQGQDRSETVRYELVMGERRWRASMRAGLESVPAIVRETDDDALLRDALLENLHRSQLNPLDEAAAYQQLLDDFGGTHEELASRLGRSRPQISNTIRLLRLPPPVARRVAAGVLSAGHARALLALSDAAAIERLAQRIVAEGLSVRSVEEIVAVGADDGAAGGRRPRPPQLPDPVLAELAARLSDRLDTRVQITMGRRKGRLSVEFAAREDLQRILGLLLPDATGSGQPGSAPGDGDRQKATASHA